MSRALSPLQAKKTKGDGMSQTKTADKARGEKRKGDGRGGMESRLARLTVR